MKRWSTSLLVYSSALAMAVATLVSCAKVRPVERLNDPDGIRLTKQPLLGKITAGEGQGQTSHWIGKATVTKTSRAGGFLFVGLQSEAKVGHFNFTKDKLQFLNDVSPYTKDSPNNTPELINSWSITHFDKKLAESDGHVTNKEEEDKDKPFAEKRFFTVDFSKADITESATFPYYIDAAARACWAKKASYMVDDSMTLDEDYFSFVVGVEYELTTICNRDIRRGIRNDYTYTVHYTYSFKRLVANDYEPYVYTGENDPVMRKFGYFKTVREQLNPKNGLFQNVHLMNRWAPGKTHNFFFTKGFPEKYKVLFTDPKTGIFARTNQVFAEKGLTTRFAIHENNGVDGKEKKFGDIRYSFVNFIEAMDPSAPFGYGPSDANPWTGEIISANMMVWTGFLKYYLERLELSEERKPTKFTESPLFNEMSRLLDGAPAESWASNLDLTRGVGFLYNELLPEVTYAYPGWSQFTNRPSKLFNFAEESELLEHIRQPEAREAIRHAHSHAKEHIHALDEHMSHERNTTMYPINEVLANAGQLFAGGSKGEDIINSIVYRVAIHEFGHNIGLRHNFYGSIDSKNFGEPVVTIGPNGQPVSHPGKTSSVMEYLALEDETHLQHDWEPYDKAAIQFAYSGGKVESDRTFLFCTDEHRPLNGLCNHWDTGTSPSEVLMSMIERYENMYFVRNFRRDRAYWNTRGYSNQVFSAMWDVKRFLLMWRAAFSDQEIGRKLGELGVSNPEQVRSITRDLSSEFERAVDLSMVFYNAVVRQSAALRPFRDEIEPFTGEINRIGILADKLYAMMFLMGDDGFAYNPNRPFSRIGYLTYGNTVALADRVNQIHRNALTERVDMEPWFIGFSRALFARSATNIFNQDDQSLIDRIKIVRFEAHELEDYFDIAPEPELTAVEMKLVKSRHGIFRKNDHVGIVRINGRYYMVGEDMSPYAYTIVKSIVAAKEAGRSMAPGKIELLELYGMYQGARGDR